MEEATSFTQKIRKSGDSLILTVEAKVSDYEGLKEGDYVKVWIKKLPPKEV